MTWVPPIVVVAFIVGYIIGEIRGYNAAYKEACEKFDKVLNLPKRG